MKTKENLCIIQGGGYRQIEASLGILKAMDELGIKIHKYRGTSAGAIVSSLHASDNNADKIIDVLLNTDTDNIVSLSYMSLAKFLIPFTKVDHIYNRDGLKELLRNLIDTNKVSEKVQVCVTRCSDNIPLMFPGTLNYVLASSAIQEIFKPVKIGFEYYADGGLKNNIPTCKISEIKDYNHIFILLCNENEGKDEEKSFFKIGRIVESLNNITQREATQVRDVACWGELDNVTILQPKPMHSYLLKFTEGFKLIDHSYKYAKERLKNVF